MRPVKRIFTILLLVTLLFVISACQPADSPEAQPTNDTVGESEPTPDQDVSSEGADEVEDNGAIPSEELVTSGKLTIATTGNANPYTLIDDNGDLVGYDIDMCRAIAEELGLEAEFVTLEWGGILPGLSSNRFDMVCTGVGRTEERLASPDFLFSEATIQDGTGIVVRADDERFQDWEDICGMTMGGVRGAYYSSDVLGLLDCEISLTEYPGETELFLDLENGRIDFATMGYLVGAVRAQEHEGLQIVLEPFNPVTKGIPVNKNAPTLLAEVNRLIGEFSEDGRLAAWQVQWFGVEAMPVDSE